jgi:hypothetical protein
VAGFNPATFIPPSAGKEVPLALAPYADPTTTSNLAAPPHLPRRRIRVRGTSITLLKEVRERAQADLGFDVDYELMDFITCQRQAAMQPEGYDIYEQCFHNLDIVWFWGALQPIDTQRIADWDKITDLSKEGGISKYAWRGHGDAPVRKLYVQPGGFLGPKQGRYISMLPTVHNMDVSALTRGCLAMARSSAPLGHGFWIAVPRGASPWLTNPRLGSLMRP